MIFLNTIIIDRLPLCKLIYRENMGKTITLIKIQKTIIMLLTQDSANKDNRTKVILKKEIILTITHFLS